MKKIKLSLIAGTLFTASILANTAHAVIDRGTMLANTCAACHGVNGISQGDIPSIAGLPKNSIIATMNAFSSGNRPSTVMQRIAKGYSEADIEALADHFSKLPSIVSTK